MKKLETSLLIIVKDEKILLARKKRGFAKGKLNGVGGKRQEGETIYDTMLRETMEEIGITPILPKQVGQIEFQLYIDDEPTSEKMYIYLANDYEGEPIESDEMKPEWHNLNDIPYDNMFEDDKLWLPEVLKGNLIKARFMLDKELKMTSQEMEIVDGFEGE